MNSNYATLTSACDSVPELRLAREGEAKANRMERQRKIEREKLIKRKNAMHKSVKVVEEQNVI